MADTTTPEARVEPALYVGTYAKYNNGSIAGKWLHLCDHPDAEAFLRACGDLHADEADPELMFQDFEGFPKDLYGEAMSLTDLRKLYDWVHLSEADRELCTEYLDATGYPSSGVDVADVQGKLFCVLDRSAGQDENTAMGQHVLDDGLVDVPEHLVGYVNTEALGRDWLMDLVVSSNGYVFQV